MEEIGEYKEMLYERNFIVSRGRSLSLVGFIKEVFGVFNGWK
jgi:hypothetical protein